MSDDEVTGSSRQDRPAPFRFGFIYCSATNDVINREKLVSIEVGGWARRNFRGGAFFHHPETPIMEIAEAGSLSIVLIGEAFDPAGAKMAETLKAVARLPVNRAIEAASRWSGRYAAFVDDGSKTYVINDPFGSRTIFYCESIPLVGSHARLLADIAGCEADPSVVEIVNADAFKKRTVRYLPGNLTLHASVRGLPPNCMLQLPAMSVHRYWPTEAMVPTSVEELYSKLDRYFLGMSRFLQGRKVVIGVTGGADGRAILAGLLSFGADIAGVTWGSSGYLKAEEVPIVGELIARTGIRHVVLRDLSLRDDGVARAATISTGLGRNRPRLTEAMSHMFTPDHVFVRGYGGEIIRGFYNLRERPMKELSPAEMARIYGSRAQSAQDARYPALVRRAFEDFHETAQYDELSRHVEQLNLDVNDVFYWEHRMGMWGANMHNEMDPALLSMTGYNSREIFETAFGLPRDRRLTKQLLIDYASSRFERLSGLPWV